MHNQVWLDKMCCVYTLTHTCTYICLSGLWLGGLLLSYFFKLVCYAHVFPCTAYTSVHRTLHMSSSQFVHPYLTRVCVYVCVSEKERRERERRERERREREGGGRIT